MTLPQDKHLGGIEIAPSWVLYDSERYKFPVRGLEENFQEINNVTSQDSFYRNEDYKTRCLGRALLDIPWAQAAIGQLSSMNLAINQFFSSLREGLQLHAEKNFTHSTAVL